MTNNASPDQGRRPLSHNLAAGSSYFTLNKTECDAVFGAGGASQILVCGCHIINTSRSTISVLVFFFFLKYTFFPPIPQPPHLLCLPKPQSWRWWISRVKGGEYEEQTAQDIGGVGPRRGKDYWALSGNSNHAPATAHSATNRQCSCPTPKAGDFMQLQRSPSC